MIEPFRELKRVSIRLSESQTPYPERLQILRAALAPTSDRGAFENGGLRQDHFAAAGHGWQLTYENVRAHQIRIAYPPDDEQRARRMILGAVDRMGCRVLTVTTRRGQTAWG